MKTSIALAFVACLGASLSGSAQIRFATLYTFTNGAAGELTSPGSVIYGAFDGSTPTGSDCGGIFELRPPSVAGGGWTETMLYSFADSGDACVPIGLVPGAGGVLYGVAELGGAYGYGALFELEPPASPGGTWTESVLYSFSFGNRVGGNLLPGPAGSFYVLAGGLFQLQPPAAPGGRWTGTLLYTFTGTGPVNSLTAGPHGVLYGTIPDGAASGGQLGQVFQLTPPAAPGGAWSEMVIHNFGYGGHDAGNPNSLTVTSDGTILHEWTNGQGPYVDLMDQNGVLYGTTQTFEPGAQFYGTVFALATN